MRTIVCLLGVLALEVASAAAQGTSPGADECDAALAVSRQYSEVLKTRADYYEVSVAQLRAALAEMRARLAEAERKAKP